MKKHLDGKSGKWWNFVYKTNYLKLSKILLFVLTFSILLFLFMLFIRYDNEGERRLGVFVFYSNIIVGFSVFLILVLIKLLSIWSPKLVGIIVASVLVCGVGYVSANYDKLFDMKKSVISEPSPMFLNNPTVVPLPTSTPTIQVKPKTQVTTSANNTGSQIECIGPDGKQFKTSMDECKKLNESWNKTSDYMVNCNVNSQCGGGTKYIKSSECNNSTCCQIGESWYFYTSRSKCTEDQKKGYHQGGSVVIPTVSNYPPCTIYYPALGYSSTYNYTSPEQCQKWKNEVSSTSTPAPTVTSSPTIVPQPTTDPALCAQAVTMWNDYKADFMANRYNTYSSSFEAIQALESERQYIQNELISYGCTNKISL